MGLGLADPAAAALPAAHHHVGCGEYSVGGGAELVNPTLYWPNLAVVCEIAMGLLWLYQSFLYLLLRLPGVPVQLGCVPHLEQLLCLLHLPGDSVLLGHVPHLEQLLVLGILHLAGVLYSCPVSHTPSRAGMEKVGTHGPLFLEENKVVNLWMLRKAPPGLESDSSWPRLSF